MSSRFGRSVPGAAAIAAYEGNAAGAAAGVAVLGEELELLDARGEVVSSVAAPRGARRLARSGGAWLVVSTGGKALACLGDGAKKAATFAKGMTAVEDLAVAGGQVAVARAGGLELWGEDGERLWKGPAGTFVAVAFAGEHVLGLDDAGALVFASRRTGEPEGTLRLASPEDVPTWRLVGLGRAEAVLALGEWLVWIDAGTRKTVRRVRARAKVRAVAAAGDWVVAGCEDGWVQSFQAGTGEARAAFEAHAGEVVAVALGGGGVLTLSADGEVRGWDRGALQSEVRVTAPVTALAARADVAAAADRDGRVRILSGAMDIGSFVVGQPVIAVFLDRDEAVVAATSRVVLVAPPPWHAPKPLALRTPATTVAADEAYVFAGTAAGTVDVFDLHRGAYVTSYTLSDGEVSALCRLPGALLVVGTGALDGRVFVVDVSIPKVVHRIEAHDDAFGVTCLAADPRGRIVASGSDEGKVALVDPARGKVLLRVELRETPVSIAFEATGRRFAAALADGRLVMVTLGAKGATVVDAGLRGVARVAWGASEVLVGFQDGRVERLVTATAEPARARR